ncbi:hypothetical protein [Candidatus Trichorickettsia mobilis]|uniref:hypothetical protein n=1 Tax=Candidatus Trichorickettsia mobilis TaxID=1346319 RepID=UPI00396F67B0
MTGLKELSSRPHSFSRKISDQQAKLVLSLRNERKSGVRRIQSEIKRLYDTSLSLSTIHKIFKNNNISYLQKKRHYRKQVKRYNCKFPGELVQIELCKIAGGLYQYTAIDDANFCINFSVHYI